MSKTSNISRVGGVALLILLVLGAVARADVVMNEIHYEADEKPSAEEFIELYNTSTEPVDLSGWFFSDGISFTFPPGASIPGEGFVVVAEDPATLERVFGYADAYGPWEGRLDNDGELVALRDASGALIDRVDYSVAFPWPTASAGDGSSMELIHPSLDNDLGSSWRASGLVDLPDVERSYLLTRESADWRYRKATSEPSSPSSAWRELDFVEDGTWLMGRTSIGYGDDDDNTVLDDMMGNYLGVYLRHGFSITGEIPRMLKLATYVDDGMIVWINGVEVLRLGVAEGDHDHTGRARIGREARWEEHLLRNAAAYLVEGENIVAVHAMNQSISSNDFSFDLEVFTPGSEDFDDGLLAFPSPGAKNSVFSENAPPNIRQVNHSPASPRPGQDFVITARVTDPDGIASVRVLYQIVEPGDYIPALLPLNPSQLLSQPTMDRPPNPAFENPSNWTGVDMVDDGAGADAVARDGIYTARLPGQINRTLVRYRVRVEDSRGASIVVPYADDPQLNFALFVYGGVPPYRITARSVRPEGVGYEYPREVMHALPVYTLITRQSDWDHCIAYNSSFQIPKSNENGRDKFNWEGAFVYNGVVYDHVRYRLRQANDRYGGQGKRSMRIRFNKGHYAQLHDNYGRPYPTRWRTINTGKMFDNLRVGNFGLTETLNHDLWNLMGVAAPYVHTFHFRVVKGEEEAPEGFNGQYFGDFQGMHLAFEDYDPRFLDAHGLEDGNLYKLKDGQFNGNELKRNQSRWGPTGDADFQNIRMNLRPERTEEWLDLHVNYARWSRYHAVVEGVRHYDFVPADSHSKNRAWYFEPFAGSQFGRLWTLPWDSDASWGPNWNSGIDYSKQAIFSSPPKVRFRVAYRNTIREFIDLVWTQEAIHTMIDDLSSFIVEFSKADRDRWRGAPSQAGSQDFGPMEAKALDMKRFAFVGWSGSTGPTVPAGGRRRHLETIASAEGDGARIPATPVLMSRSPGSFPIDQLVFAVGEYSDPQGDALAAVAWRIGEVEFHRSFDPTRRRAHEMPAVWEQVFESGGLEIEIPRTVVAPGRRYRVRARFEDETGRTSHWSEPIEFEAGPATSPSSQAASVRITEIHFNPFDDEGFEFIELQNVGSAAVDLRGLRLVDGVEIELNETEILDPGEYAVLVNNKSAFTALYGDGVRVVGQYRGNLSNDGERIRLIYGAGETILDFEYDDLWHPLADGLGHSLVLVDPQTSPLSFGEQDSWRPSLEVGGSPGRPDEIVAGLQLPGDTNQNGNLEISDAVTLFGHLFLGSSRPLPCDGGLESPGNRTVFDIDGSQSLDLTDGIRILSYLFSDGSPPALGTSCVLIEGCPSVCIE